MRFFLDTVGCRLNQSEMDSLARELLAAGHEVVAHPARADAAVLNTCAVTAGATRDGLARTRRLHRAGVRKIVLTGCQATLEGERLRGLPGVSLLVPNREKGSLAGLLATLAAPALDRPDRAARLPAPHRASEPRAPPTGRTRAFVKVQDGCDLQCTFCATTLARGPGRSRHLADVVREAQELAARGYREVVLTGVHLASYGRDLGSPGGLERLVRALLERTDIPRLRLSSLEPWDLEDSFFALWEDPRLLPHLHLPLQSGSDRILKRMGRRTSRARFRRLLETARARIPELAVTTDLVSGFPGETEADFQETLGFVREMGFARLHVFTYSERPGTAAAAFPDPVPAEVRKERTRRLIALGRELALAFHRRYVGRVAEVLWESGAGLEPAGGPRFWSGYTRNYLRVTAASGAPLGNRIIPARLLEATAEGLTARVVGGGGARGQRSRSGRVRRRMGARAEPGAGTRPDATRDGRPAVG